MHRGAIEQLILLGDKTKAAQLVPIVRAKAIDFARQLTAGACLNHKIPLPNGWAKIQVREGRRKLIIYVESGGVLYEFFTSELIDEKVLGTPPNLGGANPLSICGRGSFHKIFPSSAQSKPLVDLCVGCVDGGDPAEDPESITWPVESCETNTGLQYMKTPFIWNWGKTPFHIWYSNGRGDKFVVSQHDVNAYYSRRKLMGRYNGDILLRNQQYISDGSFQPLVFTYDGYAPSSWFSPEMAAGRKRRKACIVSNGVHNIMVMVDNLGKWYAWEAGQYASEGDIPRVETVEPSYDYRIEAALGTWNFNSDGTRAVAVALERENTPLDDGGNVVYKATIDEIEGEDLGYGNVGVGFGGAKHLAKEDSPVLVEVSITVGLNEALDWTFSVSIIRTERYADTGNWFMAADYLAEDDRLPYPKDTLVALMFEMQYDTTDGLFLGGTHFPDDIHCLIDTAVKTMAYKTIILDWELIQHYPMYGGVRVYPQTAIYNDGYGNPVEVFTSDLPGTANTKLYTGTIRALNLKTLSMHMLREQINSLTGGSPIARSFSSWVYAYNELVEFKDDPDITQGSVEYEFVWPTVNRAPIPASYLAMISVYAENHIQAYWLNQFTWHPKGHWSINHSLYPAPSWERDYWQTDIVNTRIAGADRRTTHKALYNAAFGDTRDYPYYDDETEPDAYRGVFRTTGLWRDK